MAENSKQVIDILSKLPPFNPILTKLMANISNPDVKVEELAGLIESDSVLAGTVLRIVNSAAYGRMSTVSNVRHAIAMLGTNRLRNIVMGLSACNLVSGVTLPSVWSARAFNLHSIAVANLTALIAQNVRVAYPEGAFVAGLLHDVGKLAVAVSAPREYGEILAGCSAAERELHEVEMENWGFSHAAISQAVLAAWKLPEPIQVAVLYHHSPEMDPSSNGLMSLSHAIRVADSVVNTMGYHATPSKQEPQDPAPVLAAAGLGSRTEKLLPALEKEMAAIQGVL